MTTVQQKYQEFLETVSSEYIKTMRHSGIWGGDIEVGAISRLLQVKIKVYRRITGEPPQEDIIGDNNVPHTIHVIYNGSHYDVCNENGKRIKKATPNGNCLFESCIEGAKLQGIAVNATYNTVAKLREHVCNDLQNQILENPAGDPIKARFEAFIQYDSRQKDVFEVELPDCKLRNEAIELRNLLNPRIPHEEDSNGLFQYSYRENIPINNPKEKLHMPISQHVDYINKQLEFLYEQLKKVEDSISQTENLKVVLLYGKTGAGKSTILACLEDSPLVYRKSLEAVHMEIVGSFPEDEEIKKSSKIYLKKEGDILKARLMSMSESEGYEIVEIPTININQNLTEEFLSSHREQILRVILDRGHIEPSAIVTYEENYKKTKYIGDGYGSKTKVPRFLTMEESIFCDLPGFNDTRGDIFDIINAYCIKSLISTAKGVRFVFVEKELSLTDMADDFGQINQLLKMFPTVDTNNLADSLLIVGTHAFQCTTVRELQNRMIKKANEKLAEAKKQNNLAYYSDLDKLQNLIRHSRFYVMQHPKEVNNADLNYLKTLWNKNNLLRYIDSRRYVKPGTVIITLTHGAKNFIDEYAGVMDKTIRDDFEKIKERYDSKITGIYNSDNYQEKTQILDDIKQSLNLFVNKDINEDNVIEEIEELTKKQESINYEVTKKYIKIFIYLKKIEFSSETQLKILQSISDNIRILKTNLLKIKIDIEQIQKQIQNEKIIQKLTDDFEKLKLKELGNHVEPEIRNTLSQKLEDYNKNLEEYNKESHKNKKYMNKLYSTKKKKKKKKYKKKIAKSQTVLSALMVKLGVLKNEIDSLLPNEDKQMQNLLSEYAKLNAKLESKLINSSSDSSSESSSSSSDSSSESSSASSDSSERNRRHHRHRHH